ncbi:SURF1 family protein [Motilimonas pumila]|nr:SURF1 family protein [Motilimonas pumila]
MTWVFVIINLALILIMVKAGLWQLDRAAQKQHIASQLAQADTTLQQWSQVTQLEKLNAQYQTVALTGALDIEHAMLLDNKVWQGQVGYHVVVPLVQGSNAILVNLGWVAQGESRQQLPSLAELQHWLDERSFTGRLKWPEAGFQLAKQPLAQVFPQRLQYLPMAQLQQMFAQQHLHLMAPVLRLDPDTDVGFVRQWQWLTMPAAKHTAYAWQWFTMAFVLAIVASVFIRQQRLPRGEQGCKKVVH